jgi:hypothetical protein
VTDSGYSEKGAAWLGFGAEAVPVHDGAIQEAEWERTERLCLISKFGWSRPNPRVMLGVALAAAALAALAMTVGLR